MAAKAWLNHLGSFHCLFEDPVLATISGNQTENLVLTAWVESIFFIQINPDPIREMMSDKVNKVYELMTRYKIHSYLLVY